MDDDDFDRLLAKVAAAPRRHAPPRLDAGTERYELRRHLGRGGFGDVYEARERRHGTLVALKRLKGSDPAWLYRFKREFRLVADLSHPNLVKLYELFCEKDQWYLTMELIDGRPFGEHVARTPESLRSCFRQLALAIAELHRTRSLHRDIKPSNALVEPTGRVVLLDFGLARQRQGAIHTAVGGTAPYMAPELRLGREPSEASDWYAFGVMLYQALAGRLPYEGSDSATFRGKLEEPPPEPSTLRAGVAPDLQALALELLSPAPADRPVGDDVIARLATSSSSPHRPFRGDHDEPAAVGRDRELAVLADALAGARRGAVLVTLHGLPGMGKSTLARSFAAAATVRGARVYQGRCHESESLPFKGLDGVIDSLCDDLLARSDAEVAALVPPGADGLVQMFPVLKRVPELTRARGRDAAAASPHAARRAARGALRELLVRLAVASPIVLFIDDLQWANDDSVRLLLDLLAPPAPAILVIVAYRRDGLATSGPVAQVLDAASAGLGVTRVDLALEPLERAAVEELLARHPAGGVDAGRAMSETDGHPYLLSRLLDAGRWSDGGRPELGAVLSAQIEALGRPARLLLEVVSLSAKPLSQGAAFAVTGDGWNPLVVEELRREKLVLCEGPGADGFIEPYHARVRESALARLPAARRRELHLTMAAFLETRGRAEPEALAFHYRQAGQRALALRWTRSAARAARDALAFARAAELYRAAVELADDDRERIAGLVELAGAHVQAGHRADAGRACLTAGAIAAEHGDEAEAAALASSAGEHFLLAGHIKRGIDLLRDALAAVGVALPDDTAAAVAATINVSAALAARGLAFSPRAEDAVPPRDLRRIDLELAVGRALALTDVRGAWITSQALADALAAGEPRRVQRAMASFAFSNCARAPDHPLIVECVAQARRLAEQLDDDHGRAWAQLASSMWRAQRAEFPAAIEDVRDAQRGFLAHGHEHAREAAMTSITLLVLLGNYGIDIPAAQREHRPCLEDAVERDDLFAANWARAQAAWLLLAGGDVAAARESLALARRSWPAADEELFAATALVNEIAIELYDQPATSWATVERQRRVFDGLYASLIPATRGMFHRLSASSALAAFAAGGATRAETIARIEPSVEVALAWPYGGPMTRAVEAFLCAAVDDTGGYQGLLAAAEEGWERQGQRGPMLTARLRLQQFRRQDAAAEAVAAELRAFGVADPDRYALLYAGPRVTARRA